LRIIVIGAGAAGTAAAWRARQAGADVTVLSAASGSTSLYSGALDLDVWEQHGSLPLAAQLSAFATALGCWTLPKTGCRVATRAGIVRPAAGHDSALLDLAPLRGRRIAVADVERDDWDGPLIAKALAGSEWSRQTGTQFELVRLPLLQAGFERRISPADFAAMQDGEERGSRMAEALVRVKSGFDAFLLGPWLGLLPQTAGRVRRVLGLPVGETTSLPGGPAGARFDQARDQLLEKLGAVVKHARVTAVRERAGGVSIDVEAPNGPNPSAESLDADVVLLAPGGVAAGGIRLTGNVLERAGFALSFAAPVRFELDGRELDGLSSLYGFDAQKLGMPALERVGITTVGQSGRRPAAAHETVGQSGRRPAAAHETGGEQVLGSERLLAAGDVVAGRPRTVLEAVRAGIAATDTALAWGMAQRVTAK
jgi:anaerobic glycerol-3-phosphate dehydrogenase